MSKENLKMLEVERQMVVDREKKTLEQLEPCSPGWSFAEDRLRIARVQLEHAKWRQHE